MLIVPTDLKAYVFEESSPSLWASVNREFSSFLTTLWSQGGLFGSKSQDAFFVRVDELNNTPQMRAEGLLQVDIGLAVSFPAEFVTFSIEQTVQKS